MRSSIASPLKSVSGAIPSSIAAVPEEPSRLPYKEGSTPGDVKSPGD
jgi:hypothetical protein